jgi:dienelactone hydrolase
VTRLINRDIQYSFGGLQMDGYFSVAADGPQKRPGVLIVHDAYGLDGHCIKAAQVLAAEGFASFAIDLWGDRKLYTNADDMQNIIGSFIADGDQWMGRVRAAHDAFAALAEVDATKIGAIGYCLGGSTVLEYARVGNDVRGVASFHGGLDLVGTDWLESKTRGKLLICTGVEDPLVPWESIAKFQDNLRRGAINWELDVYAQTKHSFTRPDADRFGGTVSEYNEQAAVRSWQAMTNLMRETFAAS